MSREYGSKRSRRGSSVPQQLLVMVVTFILGYFTASIFDIDALSHWLSSQVVENHQAKNQPAKELVQNEHIPAKPKFEFYTLLANEKGVGAQPVAANRATSTSSQTLASQQAALANAAANAVTTSSMRQVNSTARNVAAATTAATTMKSTQLARSQINTQVGFTKKITPVKAAPVRPGKNNFVVQVASFKARQDAEHMKGLLILKGFEVTVVPVAMPQQGNWFRVIIGPYPNKDLALKAQSILAKTQRLRGMVRSA